MTERFSWPPSSPWWRQQQQNEEETVANWAKGDRHVPQERFRPNLIPDTNRSEAVARNENLDVSRETNSSLGVLVLGMVCCVIFAVGASVGAAATHSYGWLFVANVAFFVAFILLALGIAQEGKD